MSIISPFQPDSGKSSLFCRHCFHGVAHVCLDPARDTDVLLNVLSEQWTPDISLWSARRTVAEIGDVLDRRLHTGALSHAGMLANALGLEPRSATLGAGSGYEPASAGVPMCRTLGAAEASQDLGKTCGWTMNAISDCGQSTWRLVSLSSLLAETRCSKNFWHELWSKRRQSRAFVLREWACEPDLATSACG